MLSGVTMYGPESIYIEQGIPVGMDTVIHPGSAPYRQNNIGIACVLEPDVSLHDCTVADNAVIGAGSSLKKDGGPILCISSAKDLSANSEESPSTS
jgi:bifunctional UDP-N-acetylglucosamine pyrophosphorylase / glucosamine-1-phosphate N-acetyltransferase